MTTQSGTSGSAAREGKQGALCSVSYFGLIA